VKLTPTKTPLVVKKMFPEYVWDVTTNENALYLTFDDGPTPEITNWVLKTLNAYNAKATFFCIGKNVNEYPELFKHILKNGHRIGNHTYNHIKGWKTKTKTYLENVLQAEQVIANQFSSQESQIPNSSFINHQSLVINLFRPPYGQIKPKQGKKLMDHGYKVIMWDVLSFDWDKTITNEGCYNHVISKSKKGSIIVFHDSVKAANNLKFALPKVLDYYSEKGFVFKAIPY
jgi:peptidoglycan/xylan/chitin deacetylase (PgdA/CDA1 family)